MMVLASNEASVFAIVPENEGFSSSEKLQSVIIPPVDFTCVRVELNGDISMDWIPATAGSGTFIEYQLFCLQSGPGPIATFSNINSSAYTHIGAAGNSSVKDYYMVTLSDCGGLTEISHSDTVSSIFLEINDLGDGRVFVEWNPVHNPQLQGEASEYKILREFPTGNWQVRKLVPFGQFNYRDTIDICNAFINYKIEVENANGCISSSNIVGDQLEDIINPYIPVISRVTVDTATQNVKLFWNQNQSSDTYGYIILKLINGFWENIDTVYGIATTSYIDYGSIEDIQSETYAVAAFDSCIVSNVPPNYQTSAASESHTTIFAESTVNNCDLNLLLNWTTYVGWKGVDVIDKYEILVKKNDGQFEILDEVASDKAGYNYNGLEVNSKYCFYIRAVSSTSLYSYSNLICEFIVPPSNPDFHYLANASHISDGEIELELYSDPSGNALVYEIFKKGPYDFDFALADTITPTLLQEYRWIDNDVNERGHYEYKVGIVDSCNKSSNITPITKSIYLSVDRDLTDDVANLSWTEYEGYDGNIEKYIIYRWGIGVSDTMRIDSVLPNVRIYEDDLSNFFDSQGGFCYKVEAVETFNSFGRDKKAFSNEVCLTLDPIIYIPNAFVVCGVNREFKPVIDLYDFDTYQMEIFNREGGKIFETEEIDRGWKGRMPTGELAQEGIFVFRITFRDAEGRRYEKTGTLTLLHR
ncbi:MAG: gliding motility-associated C-terminal domain-containing protein [Crocinitomicaceae bacterium]